jgi:hypothetical protein
LDTQQQMFNKQRTQHHSIVKAIFVVSEKKSLSILMSFGEGEFIKECLVDVASIICPEKKKDFENICLSRRTVARRIEMMADDTKKRLK